MFNLLTKLSLDPSKPLSLSRRTSAEKKTGNWKRQGMPQDNHGQKYYGLGSEKQASSCEKKSDAGGGGGRREEMRRFTSRSTRARFSLPD